MALSVIETSGELVMSTKYAEGQSHAENYLKILEKRAGNITGMGIKYGNDPLIGSRMYDFTLSDLDQTFYSRCSYDKFTLIGRHETRHPHDVLFIKTDHPYEEDFVLIRPDGYIAGVWSRAEFERLKTLPLL